MMLMVGQYAIYFIKFSVSFKIHVYLFIITGHSELCMDKHIFMSDSYQRAFQYLNYQGADLDHFKSKGVVGSPEECLETLLR